MPHWRNVGRLKARGKHGNGLCPVPEGWHSFWSYARPNIALNQWSLNGHTYTCRCGQRNHYYAIETSGRFQNLILVCRSGAFVDDIEALADFRRID